MLIKTLSDLFRYVLKNTIISLRDQKICVSVSTWKQVHSKAYNQINWYERKPISLCLFSWISKINRVMKIRQNDR